MNKLKTVGLSLIIIILNLIIGHFFAPIGILLTPIVLIGVSVLVAFFTKGLLSVWKSVVFSALIGIHDIGIKLYSGGRHDYEGLGFLHLMLFIGLVPAYVILLVGIFKTKNDTKVNKWLAVVFIPHNHNYSFVDF